MLNMIDMSSFVITVQRSWISCPINDK